MLKLPESQLMYEYQMLTQLMADQPFYHVELKEKRMLLFRCLSLIQICVKSLSIRSFEAHRMAIHLSEVEQKLFQDISLDQLLSHSSQNPCPSIQSSTDFFNYLTLSIGHCILEEELPSEQMDIIRHWINIGKSLFALRNYQTLKAVISALNTPPILRLKRAWGLLPLKFKQLCEKYGQFMSEQGNFKLYRDSMGSKGIRPAIPYLGVYIHDISYLKAAIQKDNLQQDARIQSILQQLSYYQKSPSYTASPETVKLALEEGNTDIVLDNVTYFTSLSQELKFLSKLNKTEVSKLIQHWIVSRPIVSERQLDQLSKQREPRESTPSKEESELSDPSDPRWLSMLDFGKAVEFLNERNVIILPELMELVSKHSQMPSSSHDKSLHRKGTVNRPTSVSDYRIFFQDSSEPQGRLSKLAIWNS